MMDGRFRGFPAGRLRATSIPDLFFSELLPLISDLAELRVILHIFWRVQARHRKIAAISLAELRQDEALSAGLSRGRRDSRWRAGWRRRSNTACCCA